MLSQQLEDWKFPKSSLVPADFGPIGNLASQELEEYKAQIGSHALQDTRHHWHDASMAVRAQNQLQHLLTLALGNATITRIRILLDTKYFIKVAMQSHSFTSHIMPI